VSGAICPKITPKLTRRRGRNDTILLSREIWERRIFGISNALQNAREPSTVSGILREIERTELQHLYANRLTAILYL
jgi:hypothetical protein